MSNATKPVVLNEGVVQILERLIELRAKRESSEDQAEKGYIWKKIHELQWEIAPVLETWVNLIAKAGLFDVVVTGLGVEDENEYLCVNDVYMLGDPDYLPLLALVTEKGGSIRK